MMLVTGSTGFLGKHLIEELIKENKKFRCFVRKVRENKIDQKGDLLDAKSIDQALKDCSLVIHLANITGGNNIKKINEQGTKNLIDSCKKNNIKKIIYISSTAAIDGDNNEYAYSKINCEKIVKESGLKFIIIRPSMIFGEGDNKNYALLNNRIKKARFFFTNSAGKCLIHPVWVKDVAKGIIACIKKNRFNGQIYILAARSPIRYNDFINLLNNRLGYPAKIIYLPHFLTEPKAILTDLITGRKRIKQEDRVYDLSKEKRELNYDPHSVSAALNSF